MFVWSESLILMILFCIGFSLRVRPKEQYTLVLHLNRWRKADYKDFLGRFPPTVTLNKRMYGKLLRFKFTYKPIIAEKSARVNTLLVKIPFQKLFPLLVCIF